MLPGGMCVLKSPTPSARAVSVSMQRLEAAIEKFNHAELFDAIADIVPSYRLAGLNRMAQATAGVE
jgi:hypothetical protein